MALAAQPAVVTGHERIADEVVGRRERRVVVGSVVSHLARRSDVEEQLRVADVRRVRIGGGRLARVDRPVADGALNAFLIDVVERGAVAGRGARLEVGRWCVAAKAKAATARAVLFRDGDRGQKQRIAGRVRHHRTGPGVPRHIDVAVVGLEAAMARLTAGRGLDRRAVRQAARRGARARGVARRHHETRHRERQPEPPYKRSKRNHARILSASRSAPPRPASIRLVGKAAHVLVRAAPRFPTAARRP